MKLVSLAVVALGMSLVVPAARAQVAPEPNVSTGMEYAGQVLNPRGFVKVDIPGMAPPEGDVAAAPPSRVLFVDDCKPNGCSVVPGNFSRADDSRTNVSSIVQGSSNRTLSAYNGSTTAWNAIIACVRENFAPFNIQVVTDEPAANTSYFKAFAAGTPANVGFPSGVAGVASFTCGMIPNAISFSFLNLNPNDVNDACWTISQEAAHNFGLSHSMLAADAMTYIQNPARKRFVNQTACIGTQGCCSPSQECQCNVPNDEQNSYQKLLTIFGAAGATAPAITIDDPINNAAVPPGFPVHATVTDDQGVAQVELLIDGNPTASLTSPPWAFNAPATITPGVHAVAIRATDTVGGEGTVTINVNVGDPCEGNGECAVVGEGYVCVDGRCVPGSGVPGGLGAECDAPSDCLSGVCAAKGGENRCTEACDTGNSNSCGDGFSCIDNPAGGGLCWPGEDGTCGGCDTDGGSTPALPIGAGLMLSALLLRRRKHRA